VTRLEEVQEEEEEDGLEGRGVVARGAAIRRNIAGGQTGVGGRLSAGKVVKLPTFTWRGEEEEKHHPVEKRAYPSVHRHQP